MKYLETSAIFILTRIIFLTYSISARQQLYMHEVEKILTAMEINIKGRCLSNLEKYAEMR